VPQHSCRYARLLRGGERTVEEVVNGEGVGGMAMEFGGDIGGEQAGWPEPDGIAGPVLELAGLRRGRIDIGRALVGGEAEPGLLEAIRWERLPRNRTS
jgi:hypothetical protein